MIGLVCNLFTIWGYWGTVMFVADNAFITGLIVGYVIRNNLMDTHYAT